jgi:hypothetical protein
LQELGFSLLGVKLEKLPLWGGTYREVALASEEAEAYASIGLRKDGRPRGLYFYTPLRDAGMVFTRNRALGGEAESERLSVKNVPTQNFKEILDSHQQRLRVLKERGLVPSVGLSQQARIEATRAFYASGYARRRLARSRKVLRFCGSLLLLLAAVWFFVIRSQ